MLKNLLFFFFIIFILTPLTSQVSASNTRNKNTVRTKICQSREANLSSRMEKITNMSTNMLNNFDAKSDKVQKYYTEALVPKNIIVPNFGDLVTDVQNKKLLVQKSLSQAQAESNSFSCTEGLPTKSISDFRKSMQDVNSALKNYRTSIKNLIVAIRTASNNAVKS